MKLSRGAGVIIADFLQGNIREVNITPPHRFATKILPRYILRVGTLHELARGLRPCGVPNTGGFPLEPLLAQWELLVILALACNAAVSVRVGTITINTQPGIPEIVRQLLIYRYIHTHSRKVGKTSL